MADTITLRAETRDRAGKGAARAARRAGRIPAVIYGEGKPATMISLDPKELGREVGRAGFFARLVNIEIDGKPTRTLPRDVQLDPIFDQPIHADFLRVNAGTKITVAVPVQFVGQESSPGIRRGGMLNIVRHEVELVCPVENIPDRLTVSLEGTNIGDTIHIGSVALPEGTHATVSRNFTIASIAAPTAVRDEQAAAIAAQRAAETAAATPAEGEAAAGGAAPAAGAAAPAGGAKPAAKG
jgi:large subunit ribosomal protein L25